MGRKERRGEEKEEGRGWGGKRGEGMVRGEEGLCRVCCCRRGIGGGEKRRASAAKCGCGGVTRAGAWQRGEEGRCRGRQSGCCDECDEVAWEMKLAQRGAGERYGAEAAHVPGGVV